MADPPRLQTVRLPIPDDRSGFNKQLVGAAHPTARGRAMSRDDEGLGGSAGAGRKTDRRARRRSHSSGSSCERYERHLEKKSRHLEWNRERNKKYKELKREKEEMRARLARMEQRMMELEARYSIAPPAAAVSVKTPNGASVGFETRQGGGEEKERTAGEERKSARATADDDVTAEMSRQKSKKKKKRVDSIGEDFAKKAKHTEEGKGSTREKNGEKKRDDDPIGEKKRRRDGKRQDGPDKEPMCDRERPGEKVATEAEEERQRLREAAVQLALSLPQQAECKTPGCSSSTIPHCSLKALRRHVALHHYNGPSLFRCTLCPFKANVRKSVRQHVKKCHSDADPSEEAFEDRRSDKTWISIWQLVLSCFGVKEEEEEEDEVDLMCHQLRERENAQPMEQSPMKSDCSSDCEWREEGAEMQRGEKRRKREMVEEEDRERQCRVDSDCSNGETDETSEYREVEMEQGDGPLHSDHSSGEETGEERDEEEGVTRRKRVDKEGGERGDDSSVSSDHVTSESADEGEWETRRLRWNRKRKRDEKREGQEKEEPAMDSDIDSDETYEETDSDTSRGSMREKEEEEGRKRGGGKSHGPRRDVEKQRKNVEKTNAKEDGDLVARVKKLGRRLMHGKYKCLFHECEKVVQINMTQHLRDHALVHYNGPSLFKCTLCSYRTNGLPCMWQHARVHGITSQTNRERPYVDLRTDKSAKICNTLILRCFGAHGEGCEKLRTVKCRICSSRVRNAFFHADNHLSPPGIYRCSGCGRGFNYYSNTKHHIAQCTAGARVVIHRNDPEITARLATLRVECFPDWNWHHRTPKGKAAGEGKKKSGAKKALSRVVSGGSRTAKDSPIVVVSGGSHKATDEKVGGGDERNGRQSRTPQCNSRRRPAEQ